MKTRHLVIVALAGLPLSARAQITLISQTRETSVHADFESVGGADEHPHQSSSASVFGPYSDSFSVSTFKSTASASILSDATASILSARGSLRASAFVPLVTEQDGAGALARYVIDFSVSAATPIHYHAALPTAFPQPSGPAYVQETRVLLKNLSTGATLAHVYAGWGIAPPGGPTIEPPVDLAITLQPGTYEIEALIHGEGAGFRPPAGGYSDFSTFEVSLLVDGACYANCDNSTALPILNVNDFQCFLNAFASGGTYANCDHSTAQPILNAIDFQCFLNAFAAGCS